MKIIITIPISILLPYKWDVFYIGHYPEKCLHFVVDSCLHINSPSCIFWGNFGISTYFSVVFFKRNLSLMLELLLGSGSNVLYYRTVFPEWDSFTWTNSITLRSTPVHTFPGSSIKTLFCLAFWTICCLNTLIIHCVVAWLWRPQMPVGFSLLTSSW